MLALVGEWWKMAWEASRGVLLMTYRERRGRLTIAEGSADVEWQRQELNPRRHEVSG